MSTEPAPLLLGSSLGPDIYLFMVANPGTMRNAKVPANALTSNCNISALSQPL